MHVMNSSGQSHIPVNVRVFLQDVSLQAFDQVLVVSRAIKSFLFLFRFSVLLVVILAVLVLFVTSLKTMSTGHDIILGNLRMVVADVY